MAAGFLIIRIFLVFWLSELNESSSAFPRAWHSIKKEQEGYGYGKRRPLQFIQALRQTNMKLQPHLHDQVPITPRSSVHRHARTQNQPSPYHQTQSPHEPQSQHAPLPLAKPRSFEFSLKVPFVDSQGQTSSPTKGYGGGHDFQPHSPSSLHIYTTFNTDSGPDGVPGKGGTKYPNGGNPARDISKPSFQLNLSVPIHPKPSGSHDAYPGNVQKPGSVVQNSFIPIQSQSEGMHLNSGIVQQQQTQHQIYTPVQTQYTDSKLVTFSPGHVSQPHKQGSQKIPTQQSLGFPQATAPSLLIPQYPPHQPYYVHSGYYTSPINPLSDNYGKGQSGQAVYVPPSQYEAVPSAGPVKPSDNNYGQHQSWPPVGAPPTSASEQYNYGQHVQAVPHQSPVHPSAAQPQYELPSYHQPATSNYYGVQQGGKPQYTKLFIDVEDETDEGIGQYDYPTAQQPYDEHIYY